jgi:hypothetical protein
MAEAKWASIWCTQNRHRELTGNGLEKYIDWNTTWESIFPSRISNDATTEADHSNRRIVYRLLNQKLPMADVLNKRKPELYKDNKCKECNVIENLIHIFTAHENGNTIHNRFVKTLVFQICAQKERKIEAKLEK